MLSSKVYKGGAQGAWQSVEFREFGPAGEEGCGGMVGSGASAEFHPSSPVDSGETEEVEKDTVDRSEKVPAPAPLRSVGQDVGAKTTAATEAEVEAKIQEAYAKGRLAGREELEKDFGAAVDVFADAAEQLSRERARLMKNSASDMVKLVMAVAEQVVRAELMVQEDVVLKTVRHALQAAVSCDEYRVRVHPGDYSLLTENKPLFLARISGLKNLIFESDAAVTPGGCLVESELGEVDASIEGQLAEIRQHLVESLMER